MFSLEFVFVVVFVFFLSRFFCTICCHWNFYAQSNNGNNNQTIIIKLPSQFENDCEKNTHFTLASPSLCKLNTERLYHIRKSNVLTNLSKCNDDETILKFRQLTTDIRGDFFCCFLPFSHRDRNQKYKSKCANSRRW